VAWSEEYRFRRSDGSYATVLDRGYLLRDGGRAVRLVGSMIDLTARKELEAQFRQAQKMEAVGRLAGGVAHDFNNLLMVITIHAELARAELDAKHPAAADLEEIGRATTRAAALTRQLLAFSRKQILTPHVLDLNAVVAGLEPMLHRLIGEDIAVVTRLAPELGLVLADPGQLEQVLVNLAVNARDAMPHGGTLTIATTNTELGERVRGYPAAVVPGSYVTLTVTDTGCGMSPEVQGRIFEPFYTTKPIGEGSGLGLSTVYGIVQQSGGHIGVESAPGRGTTFRLYLPRIAQEAETPRPGAAAITERLRGTETVLLVEDEEAVRRLARRVLERQGYTVLEARNGRDAVALVATHERPIDLVLTDMVMPEMSARALVEELAAARPTLRVLYMSGYTDDEILRRGLLGPDTSLLSKPFTADALAEAVRAALEAPRGGAR
jgi:signal transduction histidine kinase/ActR/RegA family two-component response regulator